MFSDNFVKLCARKGVNPTSVAEDLGYSRTTGSKWVNGSVPRPTTLQRIADYFGITVAELLDEDRKNAPITGNRAKISDEAHHIGVLFDRADEKDRVLTHSVLDKYEHLAPVTPFSAKNRNPGDMLELDVWDEPAAAGFGNYLDVPQATREQYPAFMVPKGTNFGIHISGDSMEPFLRDGMTVFVKAAPTIDSGKVGIFVLNGQAFCKQLIVDKNKKEVRLHSLNPDYEDIMIQPTDDLRTIGLVL